MPLNERQARFVAEYLVDLNATQAAIRAGYCARTAYSAAERLLTNAEIAAAIAEAQAARSRRTEVTADRVVLELARVAFGDPRRVMSWGPGGVKLRPSAELADEEAAIVAEAARPDHGGRHHPAQDGRQAGRAAAAGQHLGMLGEGKVAVTVAGAPAAAELQAVCWRCWTSTRRRSGRWWQPSRGSAAEPRRPMREAARSLLHALDPAAFAATGSGSSTPTRGRSRSSARPRRRCCSTSPARAARAPAPPRWPCTPPSSARARSSCSFRPSLRQSGELFRKVVAFRGRLDPPPALEEDSALACKLANS